MAYVWMAELSPGSETSQDDLAGAGLGQGFDDQSLAEAWLGEY